MKNIINYKGNDMKKNKLILFDWGNIVESYTTGYTIHDAFDDLFRECGYKDSKVYSKLSKYHLSEISSIEKFETTFIEMKKEFNLIGDFNNFINRYNYYFDKISYYKNVRDYEISLKDKCYIGILSNLTILDKTRLDKQVGLENYDYVFLSFELGIRKPNIEIYNKVQSKIPFPKSNVLFIDDRSDNIESAQKYGWNTLQATGLELEKIKKICENFVKN